MFVFCIQGKLEPDVELLTHILGKAAFLSGFEVQSFNFTENEGCFGIIKTDKSEIRSNQVEISDIGIIIDCDINNSLNFLKEDAIVFVNSKQIPPKKAKKIKFIAVDDASVALSLVSNKGISILGAVAKKHTKISLKNMKLAVELETPHKSKENCSALEEGFRAVK